MKFYTKNRNEVGKGKADNPDITDHVKVFDERTDYLRWHPLQNSAGIEGPEKPCTHANTSRAGTMKPAREYPISREEKDSGNRKTKSKPRARKSDSKID